MDSVVPVLLLVRMENALSIIIWMSCFPICVLSLTFWVSVCISIVVKFMGSFVVVWITVFSLGNRRTV